MINKTKHIKNFKRTTSRQDLFMLSENPSQRHPYMLENQRVRYDFPKFSIKEMSKSLMYVPTLRSVREYKIFEPYVCVRSKNSSTHVVNRLAFLNSVCNHGIIFYGSQIDRNRGGNLSASLGVISFVPRRYRTLKARALQSFMSLKLVFRRYRRFTYLYNLKANLVSTFRTNSIKRK